MSPTLPADFQWVDGEERKFAFVHIPSGRKTRLHYCEETDPQGAINYLVQKRRIEHNRDRLWGKCGGDRDRYSTRLLRLKLRGCLI